MTSRLYKHLLGNDSDDEHEATEMEEVTSAIRLGMIASTIPEPPRLTRPFIQRDCLAANERLMTDYFGDDLVYKYPKIFKHRYLMSKHLFVHLVNDLEQHDSYFKQKLNAKQMLGFTPI